MMYLFSFHRFLGMNIQSWCKSFLELNKSLVEVLVYFKNIIILGESSF